MAKLLKGYYPIQPPTLLNSHLAPAWIIDLATGYPNFGVLVSPSYSGMADAVTCEPEDRGPPVLFLAG